MKRLNRAGWTAAAILLVLGLALAPASGTSRVSAADGQPPGPDRFTVITVDYTAYEWWLIGWSDNFVACRIFVDHTGMPTGDEVYNDCGEILYTAWSETKPCPQAAEGGNLLDCRGYYIHFYKSHFAQKKVGVALPAPQVWVTLDGCSFSNSTNICSELPTLVLTGEEPLPNEKITAITVTVDGEEYTCGPVCQFDLGPTGEAGLQLSFWAASSYGDTSEVFEARVRVAQIGNSDNGDQTWYVDILSSQWRGAPSAGCAETWGLFPPVGGPPRWLSTPDQPEDLASNIPYDYLAGNLIIQGAVDVSGCADDGLLPNGAASPCGADAARPAVNDWQNRFDNLIYEVAWDTGVPAQLLKNLFSRESQFWPGVFTAKADVGLGQLTDNGADTTLLWNPSFYEQFCPLVLEDSVCRKGYPFLQPEDQEILRGALVHSVDAVCPDCPLGIDLRQADFSVSVFAQTLLANCGQAAQVLSQVSGLPPSEVSAYEDMWRFTLVNYNAGPGCLELALTDTMNSGEPLQWGYVMTHLTPVCQGAADYIADISR
ncbi:MAG: hypothetical protein FD146_1381 [Anaerolineaceae bacterium]|nr:MAG: hypothetical protein FD146_1381 [Anaerolineaceae bacterium]